MRSGAPGSRCHTLTFALENMKIHLLAIVLTILSGTAAQAESNPAIAFSEIKNEKGNKVTITCTRDGTIIYTKIVATVGRDEVSLYKFFWKDAVAATIFISSGEPCITQMANIPVSYSIYLDKNDQPYIVTIMSPDGEVIDGLLRKDGQLVPADESELPEETPSEQNATSNGE